MACNAENTSIWWFSHHIRTPWRRYYMETLSALLEESPLTIWYPSQMRAVYVFFGVILNKQLNSSFAGN